MHRDNRVNYCERLCINYKPKIIFVFITFLLILSAYDTDIKCSKVCAVARHFCEWCLELQVTIQNHNSVNVATNQSISQPTNEPINHK